MTLEELLKEILSEDNDVKRTGLPIEAIEQHLIMKGVEGDSMRIRERANAILLRESKKPDGVFLKVMNPKTKKPKRGWYKIRQPKKSAPLPKPTENSQDIEQIKDNQDTNLAEPRPTSNFEGKAGEYAVMAELLMNGYSTLSLGYIGLYEVTKLMTGVPQTDPKGEEFAVRVMQHMRDKTDEWKKQTGLGFALYGTPAESLCYRFARIDKERFGTIEDVTDKGYYTNSYHVDVRENIDAFSKFSFEAQFQRISSGGCISYVEIPNMQNNLEAMQEVVKFIYDNIQYAEFNTKSDYCHVCGWDGEIIINDDN